MIALGWYGAFENFRAFGGLMESCLGLEHLPQGRKFYHTNYQTRGLAKPLLMEDLRFGCLTNGL